ncbi:MAG: uracil-DNA glycosylase [Clostridia bacterium]|nr:uracil-DNA glycosylase [Clostridia bacterium]
MEQYRNELRAEVAAKMPGKESALVFGEGPERPRLMLIGEAPGEQETLLGRPFVGKAGKNLDRFLELAGLKREEIYISNAVKIRPTKVGKTGRIGNRPPSRAEIDFFRPWLIREITQINPQMIATLGNVPLHAVTGSRITIGEAHGRIITAGETGLPLFALYHPASLIYNRSLESVYEADVCTLARCICDM